MSAVVDKVIRILTDSYSNSNFFDLMAEILEGMQIVAPNNPQREFTNYSSHIENYTHVGTYTGPDNKKIIIMSIELKNRTYVENSRSTQRSYAKKLIENANADGALIAFHTTGETRWRLSFVRLDYEIKVESGKLKAAENITPARRYSFLVGRDEPCHTAVERFRLFIDSHAMNPTLDELEKAFSVEAVTKEFFELYREKFLQLCECLDKDDNFVSEAKLHNYTSAQFAKKLMGQIVFLYFLQKKGWLGVSAWPKTLSATEYKKAFYSRGSRSRELIPAVYAQADENTYRIRTAALNRLSNEEETFLSTCVKGEPWGSGPHNFMRRLFETSEKKGANFFEAFLEPLFYDALNVNRGEQGYDPALHCRIPFLSGGLFEPIDGYEWKHNNFGIPNELFSNRKNDKDRLADGILDIFDRYNFTMSEDEPLEREVAIDPEMLGKVFENLLDVNDRKSKGAFYTPREIVHYMCQESLINYLTSSLKVEEMAIRDFILFGDFMKDEDASVLKRAEKGDSYELWISEELYLLGDDGTINVDRMADLDKALQDVRVADPAVGSGAFPLGMLNEIVRARQNVTTYMDITQKIMDPKGASMEIRYRRVNERSARQLKYDTIRNCIFAVDIEPSAVDIAQLRLWLALVIDDEIDPNAMTALDGHRNPLPLPNLECNILCGNSLIDKFEGIVLVNESDLIGTADATMQFNVYQNAFDATLERLITKQEELFRCENTDKKTTLLQEISDLRDAVIMSQLRGTATPEQMGRYQATKHLASKPFVLWQLDFARVFREKGGFDIIIGNPPWGAKLSKTDKDLFKESYPEIDSSTTNSFAYFIGLSMRLSTSSISFVLPDSILVKDYAKTRQLIKDPLSEVIWYQNAGVPYDYRPFKSVDHDVCVIHIKKNIIGSNIHLMSHQWDGTKERVRDVILSKKDIIYSQFDYVINLKLQTEDLPILSRLMKHCPLSSIMQCHEGIHSGNIRDKLFIRKETSSLKPLYYGGGAGDTISTYYSKRSGWFVDYRKELINKVKGEYASLRDESIFIYPKIYLTRTGNPFKSFYDDESYASNNFFSLQMLDMSQNNRRNLLALLPFINSTVCQYFIRVYAAPRLGNTFIETKIIHLLKFPIPALSDKQIDTLVSKVEDLINCKKENISGDVTDIERALKLLVYDCYDLTEDEIQVIEKGVSN